MLSQFGFVGMKWMKKIKWIQLSEIAELITKGTTPTTMGFDFQENGVNFLKIECFDENGGFVESKVTHISEECNKKLRRSQLKEGDILFSIAGAIGRVAIVTKEMLPANTNQALAIIRIVDEQIYLPYVKLILTSPIVTNQLEKKKQGVAQLNLSLKDINEILMPLPSKKQQIELADLFKKVADVIYKRNAELLSLDNLIKARFVEMFGNLKTNSKGWQIAGFNECAIIDTNMIHDFQGYEDYPHIGIDSIEKETGKLVGYRTIAEDGVISGKYLFTPQHIIYSKIRPNLNKVALPDFDGLCSADAYPILVKKEICNREYMGYTLRNKYFLDYILAFSSRTNLPKVNKNQVEGFKLPLPPIELQDQFADFVKQVDKSKFMKSF